MPHLRLAELFPGLDALWSGEMVMTGELMMASAWRTGTGACSDSAAFR